MGKTKFEPTPEMNVLLQAAGSRNREASLNATHELAVALELPLRKGVMSGDITGDIFEVVNLGPGVIPEFPLDIIAPGTEKDYVAYTIPNHGRIPEATVEGDYLIVPTFEVGSSIDWLLKFARDARWDVVGRCIEVLEASFTKKINDDAWHVILAAVVDRNIVVFDSAATAGQFTKRLISLMKTTMRRNGGGNSTSVNRGKFTDGYLSPEGVEDIRDWGVDQLDEVSRREVYIAEDGSINRIFNVNLHDIDELGEDQEYQTFYTDSLGGSLQGADTELMIGLDLSRNASFYMPVRERPTIYEDDGLHRQRRAGLYAWGEHGFACLDNRFVLGASY